MIDSRLKEIKTRCADATNGRWKLSTPSVEDGCDADIVMEDLVLSSHYAIYDATFIAHARQDVPMLLEMVELLIVTTVEIAQRHPGLVEIIEPQLEKIAEKYRSGN